MLDPSVRLGVPSILVCQSEQLGDDFLVVGLQLAHQPLVGDSLSEHHDDGGQRDAGNGVTYLAETLDVLMQCFAVALTYGWSHCHSQQPPLGSH